MGALIAPHLTECNRDELLARTAHRSKRQIEELVAQLAPQPDVTSTIRKLPTRPDKARLFPNGDQLWSR